MGLFKNKKNYYRFIQKATLEKISIIDFLTVKKG